jgi:uncharacterized membrane protein
MAVRYAAGKTTSLARSKVMAAAILGIIIFLLIGLYFSWRLAALLGWDAAALTFLIWTWLTVWPLDGRLTAGHAVREDPSRTTAEAVLLAASVASLAAVGLVLAHAGQLSGSAKVLNVALGVVSVVMAWILVHTLFMLQYAELYYSGERGGIDFPKTPEPSYKDFAYLTFTMGMTFQDSDTGFQTTDFRRLALRHALISYLFGTVIVATTINLIAGLTA